MTDVARKKKRVAEPVTAVAKTKKKRSVASAKRKAERLSKDLPTVVELEKEVADFSANPQEQEHLAEYLFMFRTLKRLCRKSRAQSIRSGQSRDYYAYCTLLSQQREVIADIRSTSDLSQQVHILDENVLQPMVRSIGQNLLDSFYQMRKLITETSDVKQTQFALKKQDEIMKEQGKYLQMMYVKALDQINSALTK